MANRVVVPLAWAVGMRIFQDVQPVDRPTHALLRSLLVSPRDERRLAAMRFCRCPGSGRQHGKGLRGNPGAE
jgi:hypothetical protein